ncbi:MAG: beta-phosphoglucomutase [Clostridia bacterium]|nr:beta-phosphoglucomutase [Clostridia bacterium]
MQYKGIIFDLDGVICSTDEYHYLAWKALADRLGIPFDRERNNLLRGVSRMASLEIILEKSDKAYSDAEKAAFAEEKNTMYRELLGRMSPADLSDDIRDTLNVLREAGLKLAIGSSSKNTRFILERIGLSNFFDAVADGNCITHSKPHPEVFLKAAGMISLAPDQCIVVEDAHAGVEAAVAGGFDCAAIGDAKDDERARYHLSRISDLLSDLQIKD